jgi:nucleoside-diphosphate-sugar epimerase
LLSDVVEDYSANTAGVQNLISICKDLGDLRRVIFASSRLVCRIGYMPASPTDYCPTTAYGKSKVTGEQIVRQSTLGVAYAWTIVRPTSIWGPWFGVPYRDFFDHVRMNRYFHPSGVEVLKSFGFIENTVFQLRRIMLAHESQVAERTFFLGDYDPINVLEFANTIACAFKSQSIRTIPMPALKVLALVGDMLKVAGYRNPPLTTFRLQNLCTNMLYDFWGLEHITGTLPVSMKEGVAKTVAWMKQHGADK